MKHCFVPSKIFVCCLVFQSWGPELDHNASKISDFLEILERFINDMNGARSNIQGHVSLATTEFSPMLDEMKTASDYQNAGMPFV